MSPKRLQSTQPSSSQRFPRITDVYPLALAVAHDCRFVTLERVTSK